MVYSNQIMFSVRPHRSRVLMILAALSPPPSQLCFGSRRTLVAGAQRSPQEVLQAALRHHQAGRLKEASTLYGIVIDDMGSLNTPAAVHSNRGAALLALDRVEEAEASWQQALVVDPTHVESHLNLAISLQSDALLSPQRLTSSREHAELCLQQRPGYAKAHQTLANALQAQGDLQGAETHWGLAELGSSSNSATPPPPPSSSSSGSSSSGAGAATSLSSSSSSPLLHPFPPAFAPKALGASSSSSASSVTSSGLTVTALSLPLPTTGEGGTQAAGAGSNGGDDGETNNRRPLILQVEGLLTAEECAHIRAVASPRMQRSYAIGSGSGGGGTGAADGKKTEKAAATTAAAAAATTTTAVGDDDDGSDDDGNDVEPTAVRTSTQAWLPMGAGDEVLAKLRSKVADLLGLSLQEMLPLAEDLQVVRYGPGGHFGLHHDSPMSFQRRAITLLIYLNDVDNNNNNDDDDAAVDDNNNDEAGSPTLHAGGDTWFPFAPSTTTSSSSSSSMAPPSAVGPFHSVSFQASDCGPSGGSQSLSESSDADADADAGQTTRSSNSRELLEAALAYVRGTGPPPLPVPGPSSSSSSSASAASRIEKSNKGDGNGGGDGDGSGEEGGGGENSTDDDGWGLRVMPRGGSAVLFYNLDPCGHPDPTAIHAALPLVSGEKWIANFWVADR